MTGLPFVKMVGTGNDFIVLDLRRRRINGSLTQLAQRLCRRSRSIGADGVLAVEPSRRADVKMRIINPDGSEPTMCGNGVRCIAFYAAQGRRDRRLTIETGAGVIHTEILTSRRVRATLTTPSAVVAKSLTARMRPFTVYTVNTGVPHAVIFVPAVKQVDFDGLGPTIRHHRSFRPAGANVNFVQVLNRHTLRLRTYERGVEAETLACGTGAVAAALAAAARGLCASPVTVYPTSSERLVVRFDPPRRSGMPYRNVSLEGEVREVFQGTLSQ